MKYLSLKKQAFRYKLLDKWNADHLSPQLLLAIHLLIMFITLICVFTLQNGFQKNKLQQVSHFVYD